MRYKDNVFYTCNRIIIKKYLVLVGICRPTQHPKRKYTPFSLAKLCRIYFFYPFYCLLLATNKKLLLMFQMLRCFLKTLST